MYQYEVETLKNAALQDGLNAKAAAGWRLVAVIVHPFETAGAAPKYVTFWEKPA